MNIHLLELEELEYWKILGASGKWGSSGIWSDRIVNCSLSGRGSCTCISFACSSHRMHRPHRIDCLCSVAEVKHGSLPMVAQAIISVDSCIAKRRPFCGFEKLRPVGFCFLCLSPYCGQSAACCTNKRYDVWVLRACSRKAIRHTFY